MARTPRAPLARYTAPAAFLLGVTVAVVLIHSALGGKGGGAQQTTTIGPATHASTTRVPPRATTLTFTQPALTTSTAGGTSVAGAEYTTVRSGDTFGSIATRNGTTVTALETLNPGVSSNNLQVGQQLRVK
ncbi:MAG TPA: LysM peptidoglycan-binding domain-containing protein [Gaiellaceae bacterium]|nr:LysM peptidoglycan-binding domain-containing protein [Gaiellaceae bacterium]